MLLRPPLPDEKRDLGEILTQVAIGVKLPQNKNPAAFKY